MPEIKITIAPDGTTKILTQGFSGVSCKDATREIEKALGIVTDEKLTSEYYSTEIKNNIHINGGQQ